jgi:hypothetical protein
MSDGFEEEDRIVGTLTLHDVTGLHKYRGKVDKV